jgi:hypothetical protein
VQEIEYSSRENHRRTAGRPFLGRDYRRIEARVWIERAGEGLPVISRQRAARV